MSASIDPLTNQAIPSQTVVARDYPNGTGISLIRTSETCLDRDRIALVLSSYGCHPRTALRAANTIISQGIYETRLMTAVALDRYLPSVMKEIGIIFCVEAVIPPGNPDHYRSSRNDSLRGKHVMPRYSEADLAPFFEQTFKDHPELQFFNSDPDMDEQVGYKI